MQKVWRRYHKPPCAHHTGLIPARALSHLLQGSLFYPKEIKIEDALEDYPFPVISLILLPLLSKDTATVLNLDQPSPQSKVRLCLFVCLLFLLFNSHWRP